jgi:hypothetical protein
MRVFIQFHETYFELIARICNALQECVAPESLQFCGISLRRKTVCAKVDALAKSLNIHSCDWLNEVEQGILSDSYDRSRLAYYRDVLGDKKLRDMISCGRQLGFGFFTGGVFARTKFREAIEGNPENRWKYIVGLLDYYMERFSAEKPDLIFFNEVTFPWELAAYYVAGLLDIPFGTMCFTRTGQGYIALDNPYEECASINSLFRASLDAPALLNATLDDASLKLSAFRTRPEDPEYYVEVQKKMKRQASLEGMLYTLATDLMKTAAIGCGLLGTRGVLRFENWMDMTCRNWLSAVEVRKALRPNKLFERAADHAGSDYIYYPLHVEPEATTAILSSHMSNQLFFIEQIAKGMPAGFKLLVKEHQPMLGRRPKGFYQRLTAFPDVHLISPFDDNFSLIKKAKAVCVLTGTAGWEAIMLGVPVIVVGYAQYLGIEAGYIKCENIFKLGEYIQQALAMEPVPDKRIVLFIAATLKAQTSLTPRSVAYWHYGLDPDDVISQTGVEEMADQVIGLYTEKTAKG